MGGWKADMHTYLLFHGLEFKRREEAHGAQIKTDMRWNTSAKKGTRVHQKPAAGQVQKWDVENDK